MGRLRRGGARRSSTIFAATMFPRLAAFTTDRTTPWTSDASNCSAKMVLLCRAPLGRPELPFANGRPRVLGALIPSFMPAILRSTTHALNGETSPQRHLATTAVSRIGGQLLVETQDLAVALMPIHS